MYFQRYVLVNSSHSVTFPQQGDFLINDKYLFEIDGKNKDFTQVPNLPDSFIGADDLVFGFGNKIPLYLFGFLY